MSFSLSGRPLRFCARQIFRTLARNAHWSAHGERSSSRKTLLPCPRGPFCNGRAIRLPNPPCGIVSLVRKETIIRIQSDIGSSFHGFRHEVRPQPASQGCWNGVFEEEPDVPALPGP